MGVRSRAWQRRKDIQGFATGCAHETGAQVHPFRARPQVASVSVFVLNKMSKVFSLTRLVTVGPENSTHCLPCPRHQMLVGASSRL